MIGKGRLELILPLAVLAVLLWYSYVWFIQVPYTSFLINTNDVTIIPGLFYEPVGGLEEGDQIVSIEGVAWEDYEADVTRALFTGAPPGDVVPMVVMRDGERLEVAFEMPQPTWRMVASRVVNLWWYGYIFWAAGTATLLMLRPKDVRWRLLIAYYYLTAIWLVAGAGPSAWQAAGSGMALRVAVIASIPVYLHLHWVFPQPLRRLPRWVWWLLYGAAGVLFVLQLAQAIPRNVIYIGLAVAVVGSIILLLLHLFLQRSQRRLLAILVVATIIALTPVVVLTLAAAVDKDPQAGGAALLGLPLIPFAYLLSAYRQQIAGMGLRFNRLLVFYLYVIILIGAVIIASTLAFTLTDDKSSLLLLSAGLALAVGVLAVVTLGPYRRAVERLLFGRPLASAGLLTDFSARIATSLDRQALAELLRDELLPKLLVEQSALVLVGADDELESLYQQNVEAGELPGRAQVEPLVEQAGRYRPPLTAAGEPQPAPWVRLILPLKLKERVTGLWLLGRRAPDDIYAPSEIPMFLALANQTSVALTNIVQAESLRAMVQLNIDHHEEERNRIAREIHDQLLHGAVRLQWAMDPATLSPQAQEAYDDLIERLRKTMAGLRPGLLTYGLRPALMQLAADMENGAEGSAGMRFEMEEADYRYSEMVEQNLYRIVQEALVNACRHAEAKNIVLHGTLGPDAVQLAVRDDGKGFEVIGRGQLVELLAARHYGLWQLYERAELIGADLTIRSAPGAGCEIAVYWRNGAAA